MSKTPISRSQRLLVGRCQAWDHSYGSHRRAQGLRLQLARSQEVVPIEQLRSRKAPCQSVTGRVLISSRWLVRANAAQGDEFSWPGSTARIKYAHSGTCRPVSLEFRTLPSVWNEPACLPLQSASYAGASLLEPLQVAARPYVAGKPTQAGPLGQGRGVICGRAPL